MINILQNITLRDPLLLACGESLSDVRVGYSTFGKLNEDKSNAVWVFHALTGNSDPTEWWPGVIGHGCAIDPGIHFIVCANMLGSCYGSTEPANFKFPLITIRDQVKCFQILRAHLELPKIRVGIGGSMGGQQLLEWAVQEPDLFETIVPIATNAVHSPWGIAFNETQRMAIENNPESGIETARAIAMLSYRHYTTYQNTQLDADERMEKYAASSYQRYQGEKLKKRFSSYSYFTLSKAMDSHHIGRTSGNLVSALKRVKSRTITIGIDTDILFPIHEQKFLAEHIPNSVFHEIKSDYGHDGFLVEKASISKILNESLNNTA